MLIIITMPATRNTPVESDTPRRGKYKSFTIAEKRAILLETESASTCSVAAKHNMSECTIRRWRKQDLDAQRHKASGYLIGSGHPLSYPSEIDDAINDWVIQRRESHMAVTTLSIQRYAKQLILPHNPNFTASYGWVQKFMKRHELTLRARTSISQKLPSDYKEQVCDFLEFMRRNRRRHEPVYIMNMDETPLYFDNVPNRTVAQKGVKTVRMLSTGGEKKRCTVTLGISDNGDFLPTMVVFKGKRPLRLNHPPSIIVRVQEKGWMDEKLMLEWIELCVRSYTERRPSILVLDSFRGHITKNVKELLKKHNVVPAVIPGGCTSLLQPLDVSVNKPIKDYSKQLWCDYMEANPMAKTATKQQMVDWVVEAISHIQKNIVAKSFKVTGISNSLDGSEDHMINSNIRELLDDSL